MLHVFLGLSSKPWLVQVISFQDKSPRKSQRNWSAGASWEGGPASMQPQPSPPLNPCEVWGGPGDSGKGRGEVAILGRGQSLCSTPFPSLQARFMPEVETGFPAVDPCPTGLSLPSVAGRSRSELTLSICILGELAAVGSDFTERVRVSGQIALGPQPLS